MPELHLVDSRPPTTAAGFTPVIQAMINPRSQGEIQAWRHELDSWFEELRSFEELEQDEIFMRLASISARAAEIRGRIMRDEDRTKAAFRTRELDPFIEELDRQFRTWSRVLSVRQFEWDLSKGAP